MSATPLVDGTLSIGHDSYGSWPLPQLLRLLAPTGTDPFALIRTWDPRAVIIDHTTDPGALDTLIDDLACPAPETRLVIFDCRNPLAPPTGSYARSLAGEAIVAGHRVIAITGIQAPKADLCSGFSPLIGAPDTLILGGDEHARSQVLAMISALLAPPARDEARHHTVTGLTSGTGLRLNGATGPNRAFASGSYLLTLPGSTP